MLLQALSWGNPYSSVSTAGNVALCTSVSTCVSRLGLLWSGGWGRAPCAHGLLRGCPLEDESRGTGWAKRGTGAEQSGGLNLILWGRWTMSCTTELVPPCGVGVLILSLCQCITVLHVGEGWAGLAVTLRQGGVGSDSSTSPVHLFHLSILRALPRPTESETLDVGSGTLRVNKPPGDSDSWYYLRSTHLARVSGEGGRHSHQLQEGHANLGNGTNDFYQVSGRLWAKKENAGKILSLRRCWLGKGGGFLGRGRIFYEGSKVKTGYGLSKNWLKSNTTGASRVRSVMGPGEGWEAGWGQRAITMANNNYS